MPKCISDVHEALDSIECITSKNEPFLFLNEKDTNIVIFTCQTNIVMAENTDTFYVDGTFSYCPNFFCQLFTIHGYIGERYIPLIFILLPDKKSYYNAFLILKNKTKIRPKIILVDFESAIHRAITNVWPDSSIRGCRFHLTQSW